MILKHKDKRCRDLVLKQIRWAMATSESGDSHVCQPTDELQEKSNVQVTKRAGRRDPGATENLESRVKIRSSMRLKELESRYN